MAMATPPEGMTMKLVEPVRLGTKMNSALISTSGVRAMSMFFR